MTKFCKKCSTEKPVDDFHNDAKRKDGKYLYCKACHYAYMRNRYATSPTAKIHRQALYEKKRNDPEFIADAKRRSLKQFQSLKGRAQSLLRSAQRSPDGCSLTIEWVIRGIAGGVCPVTEIAFDLTNDHQLISGRAKNPYSPSLDRIEPKGTYSPENTRVVIWQYNMMKGELSDGEIAYICALVAANSRKAAA